MKNPLNILNVCKASAGSGKTFTLAVEYIKLLVRNPYAYRNILAVTFTNKATTEMKNRIMSQLYGLAHHLHDSDDYLMAISKDPMIVKWFEGQQAKAEQEGRKMGNLEDVVRKHAALALSLMIHDYHRFRVETIDSFFQSVLRELAHDLDLTANLKVDLDNMAALKEGVKGVIDAIPVDSDVRKKVMDYVEKRMEDNKNWSVNGELEDFGKNIFNENFLSFGNELRKRLDEPGFIDRFKNEMEVKKKDAIRKLKNFGLAFHDFCSNHGLLANNFIRATQGIYAYYAKLAEVSEQEKTVKLPNFNSYCSACLEGPEQWSKEPQVQQLVETEGWVNRARQTKECHDAAVAIVNTVVGITKHLNNLSLINTISKKVQEATAERGDFLLANTNHFLNEMIAGSDVPFIYERTGTHFEHIMIDEFQDTSVLQWDNFKPLIKNSLDANHECLLVGDVKQSIYRWRNGDWTILNGIQQDKDFSAFVNDRPLSMNFRSLARIIGFNNGFFLNAAALLAAEYERVKGVSAEPIRQAYRNSCQSIPSRRNRNDGFVRIECLRPLEEDEQICEEINKDMKQEDLWQLERLADNVRMMLEKGGRQNEICILVRGNKHIPLICDYFNHYVPEMQGQKINIVSNQAYQFNASPAVRLLVWTVRMLQNPADRFNLAMAAYYYQTDVMENEDIKNDLNKLFIADDGQIRQLLPEQLSMHTERIAMLPLYELFERLCLILQIHKIKGQDAFLFAFFDNLAKFLETNNADIDSFIDFWDEKMAQQTISDGTADGIQIMTIHKSKGLEFPSVIIPFADWGVENPARGDLMWCVPQEEPFSHLPLCPVTISNASAVSAFADDYNNEILKQYVDNLNLLYVAFTRASNNLVVIADARGSFETLDEKRKKDKIGKGEATLKTMYDVLLQAMPLEGKHEVPEELKDIVFDDMTAEESADINGRIYLYPKSDIAVKHKEQKNTENVLLMQPENRQLEFASLKSGGVFRQSNKSKMFVAGKDAEEEHSKYLDEGLLFHHILSEIQSAEDVEKVVRKLDFEGLFADSFHREDVKRLVRKAFENPESRIWFDPHWRVINENAILMKDKNGKTTTKRPDRVITDGRQTIVIDYKTGRHDDGHINQVAEYMRLLKQMGCPDVKGFVWYIRQQDIVPVHLKN